MSDEGAAESEGRGKRRGDEPDLVGVERAARDDVPEEVAADAAAAEEHDRQDRARLRLLHLDSRIGYDSSRPGISCWSVPS